ncbi:MHS family proline/betaine transporter-like MFS transporter [Burkholderia sp. OAS925]|uniref:MFS transporter n=1 Tax=Paraburkholderia TaxID=1822464 RepID=UPI001789DEB6|nr:MFS transporter [Paraburkholderia graminis]MDR6478879.1 MHS family proline/betaine transporter-like MFS transporter [Paraburkholderia graminis]
MHRANRRSLAGGVIGTFVEWYDFVIYGLSAPVLAAHFFPKSVPTAALLGTFAIYAISYFARPLGGIVFGVVGDRIGRVNTLSTTVLLMGGATFGTGLLPYYEQVGIAAPVMLLACRVLQGFSAGGETSGGFTYVIECAPKHRRGLWVSFGICAAVLPAVLVSLTILLVKAVIGSDDYFEWGWRLPFLCGGLLSLVGLWLRRSLQDSDEFALAAFQRIRGVGPRHRIKASTTLVSTILIAVQAVSGPLLVSYMYSYLTQVSKLSASTAMKTNIAAVLLLVIALPCFGALSDRIGRKAMMVCGGFWLVLTAYPAMSLVSSGTVWSAFAGQALIAIGHAMFGAGGFVAVLELLPTSVRYTGHAISYNMAYAIFGGTAPIVFQTLVTTVGTPTAPSYYVIAIAALALIVIRFTPETQNVHLRDAVEAESQTDNRPGKGPVHVSQ